MGFHKLILDLTNLAMKLVKNILGHTLKIKSHKVCNTNCKKLHLKLALKNKLVKVFGKNLKNPNFGPFILKFESDPKIESCIRFLWIKNA